MKFVFKAHNLQTGTAGVSIKLPSIAMFGGTLTGIHINITRVANQARANPNILAQSSQIMPIRNVTALLALEYFETIVSHDLTHYILLSLDT